VTALSELVAVSQRVSLSSGRLVKVRELAALLRSLPADDIDIAAHYLSGETMQGRMGIGYAALQAAASDTPAGEATLSIREVDRHLDAITAVRGAGSAARRLQALQALLSRATAAEQRFLIALLAGELRQGALAGVMVEAIAAAAELPLSLVRRAAMYASSLGAVAQAALQVALLVDQHKVGEVWDGASPIAKQLVTRDAFVRQISADRQVLGALLSRSVAGVSYRQSAGGQIPQGSYANVAFATQFANTRQTVRELISFHLDNDHVWRVSGYSLR